MRIKVIVIILFQTCALKAQVWNPTGLGSDTINGRSVNALYDYNDTLYIGGNFSTLGGMPIQTCGTWDGFNYDSIGFFNGAPNAFLKQNNSLFAGGLFYSINGNTNIKHVANYLGNKQWSSLWGGSPNSQVYSLQSYNGDLYAAGIFSNINGNPANRIARWDGNQWYALGGGLSGSVTTAHCMAVFQGELYVGGLFNSANGVPANFIAKWNGTNFSAVGGGTDDVVFSMVIDTISNRLICGGNFYTAGGIPCPYNVAAWDGTSWYSIGSGPPLGSQYFSPLDMAFYRGKLFATGQDKFVNNSGDSINYIGMFDGNDWQPLGKGLDNAGLALAVYKDELYVGGYFDKAGDSVAHKIARWYMPPVTTNNTEKTNNIKISPNPFKEKICITNLPPTYTTASVTDITGREIYSQSLNTFQTQQEICLDKLQAGVYFFTLTSKQRNISFKIVKNN